MRLGLARVCVSGPATEMTERETAEVWRPVDGEQATDALHDPRWILVADPRLIQHQNLH